MEAILVVNQTTELRSRDPFVIKMLRSLIDTGLTDDDRHQLGGEWPTRRTTEDR